MVDRIAHVTIADANHLFDLCALSFFSRATRPAEKLTRRVRAIDGGFLSACDLVQLFDCLPLAALLLPVLLFRGTYHFCTGLWLEISPSSRGVSLRSSGLRFLSGRCV